MAGRFAGARIPKRGAQLKKPKIYSDTTDDGFFRHWKPIAEKLARKIVLSARLPDSCYEDFVSDAMMALAKVPRDARWNAKYVRVAIRGGLISQLRRARQRCASVETRDVLPEVGAMDTSEANRLMLAGYLKRLRGVRQRQVIRLFLAGHTDAEIAQRLIKPSEVRRIIEDAIARMREPRIKRSGEQTCLRT